MIIRRFLRPLLRSSLTAGLCLFITLLANSASAGDSSKTVLVLGDSISAAYGMNLEQGWVALLQQRLAGRDPDYKVVNASISGDTTGGGLTRLPALLEKHQPGVLVLELGGNDGLRGYPIKTMRDNLREMTRMAQASGARVLLLPMEVPPTSGAATPRCSATATPWWPSRPRPRWDASCLTR